MRRILFAFGVAPLLLGVLASPLPAQTFRGTGPQATELFRLDEGLAVFELEHGGQGAFTVRLLSERGELAAELVDQTGPFTGSRAIPITRAGQYLLDVAASGSWRIVLRPLAGEGPAPSPGPAPLRTPDLLGQAREEGAAAAAAAPRPWGWTGRGFVGGLLAGPVGAGIAVALAGRSEVALPPEEQALLAAREPLYTRAYEEAFRRGLRSKRQEAALVGGIAGTGAFLFLVLVALDVIQVGSGTGEPPTNGPGFAFPAP